MNPTLPYPVPCPLHRSVNFSTHVLDAHHRQLLINYGYTIFIALICSKYCFQFIFLLLPTLPKWSSRTFQSALFII